VADAYLLSCISSWLGILEDLTCYHEDVCVVGVSSGGTLPNWY